MALLALANLLWAGNWVTGRALRDAFDPVSLNFWRWTLASLLMLPFALPALVARREVLRRDAGILLVLAFALWNRGVAEVGANAARITIHLLPAFGTALANLFLDESLAAFHAAGFVTILCGVLLATRR